MLETRLHLVRDNLGVAAIPAPLGAVSARKLRLGLLGIARGDGEGHGDDENEYGELHVVADGTCGEK